MASPLQTSAAPATGVGVLFPSWSHLTQTTGRTQRQLAGTRQWLPFPLAYLRLPQVFTQGQTVNYALFYILLEAGPCCTWPGGPPLSPTVDFPTGSLCQVGPCWDVWSFCALSGGGDGHTTSGALRQVQCTMGQRRTVHHTEVLRGMFIVVIVHCLLLANVH